MSPATSEPWELSEPIGVRRLACCHGSDVPMARVRVKRLRGDEKIKKEKILSRRIEYIYPLHFNNHCAKIRALYRSSRNIVNDVTKRYKWVGNFDKHTERFLLLRKM